MTRSKTNQSVFDKLFRSSSGDLVVAQRPNRSITVWLFSIVAAAIIGDRNKDLSQTLYVVADIALAVWAALELIRGDSLFRRLLGLVVLTIVIVNRVA